jgi:hypothetical protein
MNKNNEQLGGKVIASGGFGCIFSPSLKCENHERETGKISKLMTTKHAYDEYNQIEKYKSLLQIIPNYERYFLLDHFTLCQPSKLTNEDLKQYNKKCKALKKKKITKQNINQSLDKIMVINMPFGGVDIEKFVYENNLSNNNLIEFNNSLIDLLVHGILPMNKLDVYHCDIKDGNVLVQYKDAKIITRLIDWGLSFIHKDKNGIPKKLYRRPFQFNVPFSSILFNKDFMQLYDNFINSNPNPDYFQIREFVINYIFIWIDIRGPGHLSAINEINKKLSINDLSAIKKNKIKEHFIEYDITYYYIIEYISKILQKYTKNNSINLMDYFNNVFLKNIDIWGFTMIYIVFYEFLYKSYDKLNDNQLQFILKIKYIIIHFLYECPTEPINVSSLVQELTNLNKYFEKLDFTNLKKRDTNKKINIIHKFNTTYRKKNNKKLKTRKRRIY